MSERNNNLIFSIMNKEYKTKNKLMTKTVFIFKKANKGFEQKSDPTGSTIITILPTTSKLCD